MAKEWVEVFRGYDYHPHDFLVAFNRVVAEQFGPNAIRGAKRHWFSRRQSVSYFPVKTGYRQEVHVIGDGPLEIRGFPGYFFALVQHGVLKAFLPKEYREQAERLMVAVEKHLETKSIYRGKAVTVGLEFMDLSSVDLASLTYSKEVQEDLAAHIWTLIEQPDKCREAGVPLRRKVLLTGPFGSGKTMAALKTAEKAVAHGWTFMYLEPSVSPASAIVSTLEFARKYQPAIVFVEDYDREQREQGAYALNHLMNAIDGALSKTGELLVIATTNYPEKIGAGLQRPGRIDKIINFSRFSGADIERLLKMVIPTGMLDADIGWTEIAEACKGYSPVFVREVATSAKLMAVSISGDGPVCVTQAMLIASATSLREQHKVCMQETPGFKS